MQYLCCYDRNFPASSRIALRTMLETSWPQESPLVIWPEVWKRILEAALPRFVEQTYLIDVVFAGSAVSAVYSEIFERQT